MNIAALEGRKGLKVSKVSQIGIVVPDIEKAAHCYSKFLNIKPWFRSKTASNETAFEGESFYLELDIVLAFSSGLEIEFIQMLTDKECIIFSSHHDNGSALPGRQRPPVSLPGCRSCPCSTPWISLHWGFPWHKEANCPCGNPCGTTSHDPGWPPASAAARSFARGDKER